MVIFHFQHFISQISASIITQSCLSMLAMVSSHKSEVLTFHFKHKQKMNTQCAYSLNKKEWICSLFKECILEKCEIRVNLEWTFVLFTHFGVTTGITQGFRVIPEVTPKWVNNTNVHSKFTLISLFSKIHSLKSEHIHSFLFRQYYVNSQNLLHKNSHIKDKARKR